MSESARGKKGKGDNKWERKGMAQLEDKETKGTKKGKERKKGKTINMEGKERKGKGKERKSEP